MEIKRLTRNCNSGDQETRQSHLLAGDVDKNSETGEPPDSPLSVVGCASLFIYEQQQEILRIKKMVGGSKEHSESLSHSGHYTERFDRGIYQE